ncbi:MAG: cryptochrome/photolyase family protein [Bryobacterales bacterium]|nr:cryptochrome/photolyase family protein [Bryobacterales bacterium]
MPVARRGAEFLGQARGDGHPNRLALRNLVLVLGDQLDLASSAFDGFDPARDAVWMCEAMEESTHVWSHQARTVMFLSAMRHFAVDLTQRGWRVDYTRLDDASNTQTLATEFRRAVGRLKPQRAILVHPGDWRVLQDLQHDAAVPLEVREDRHFYCSLDWFQKWSSSRRQLRLEFFYREMRKQNRVLMHGAEPEGGQWNFDADNRESFGRRGPGLVPPPVAFPPDATTREVIELVRKRLAKHPGNLDHFDFPVTAAEAEAALDDFIRHRLPQFGRYQDAMWTAQPYLYHSRLSAAMNLKLLNPRTVVNAAVEAYELGEASLAAVEGFVRQILGWREYVRGIYWTEMPAYAEGNALEAHTPLPAFYWTGDTPMQCMHHALRQTLDYGYAHHIQRLMVTGLYALLAGVRPREIHEWYLAVYVDAVEWVELPNTIGMSQFADGGRMASKPYAATGKYIQRMSNYCDGCAFDPAQSTGERACPFTTLYWDFLLRNETRIRQSSARMDLQLRNLERLDAAQRAAIRAKAQEWLSVSSQTHSA